MKNKSDDASWEKVLMLLDKAGEELQNLQSIIDEFKEQEPEINAIVSYSPAPPIAYNRKLFTGSKN